MSQAFSSQPYKGTRDFYPEDLKKRNYIFETWRKVLNQNGFLEYDSSLLENAELYIAKSGQELGSKQLYSFYDKGDRHVALRPEMTPSLARIVANKFGELKFPLRWFSIPNCFRYEQPQKGRFREHWQLNVDIIGAEAGAVELEILNILGELFKSFGANSQNFKIMFNHRGILDKWIELNALNEHKTLIYAVLDDWFKKTLEENILALKSTSDEQKKPIFDDNKITQIIDLTNKTAESWNQYLEIAQSFPEIKLLLNNLSLIQPELEYDFNPCIIRGIAYYTGIVFEAFDKNPANTRALFGGGRYDNLMQLFGKQSPAIGFGWGDATMHEFLTNWNLYPDFETQSTRVGIMPFSDQDLAEVYNKLIPELKAAGKNFEIDYDYDRNEEKRWISLKKRGCSEVIKVK